MGVPLEFFSAPAINKVTIVPIESKAACEESAMCGIAEPAALLGSSGGTLLVPKVACGTITIAVAVRPLRQILKDSGADSDVC